MRNQLLQNRIHINTVSHISQNVVTFDPFSLVWSRLRDHSTIIIEKKYSIL